MRRSKKLRAMSVSTVKFIKRPLMLANLLAVGAVMIALNLYCEKVEFPRMKPKDCIIYGRIKDIEDKGTYCDITINRISFSDGETEEIEAFLEKNDIFKLFSAKCSLTGDVSDLHIGQNVKISGKFGFFDAKTNPGQFDARKYYISKGVIIKGTSCEVISFDNRTNYPLEALRIAGNFCLGLLDEALDEKDAGLMKAILLADKSDIDAETKEMYQTAGASHILAISGLHISLFATGILTIMNMLPIPLSAGCFITVFLICMYGALIGFSPSSMRAIVMFAILSFGKLRLRSYDALTAMSEAALVTLLFHPFSCLQTGFLLSYLAIIALALGMTAFTSLSDTKIKIKESLKSSLAVSLFNLPVIINSYFRVPIYSVFLNLIIVPGMSIIIPAGVLCMVWEALLPRVFNVFSFVIHVMFLIYDFFVKCSLKLPFSTVSSGEKSIAECIFYLIFLVVVCVVKKKLDNEFYRRKKVLNNKKRWYPERNVTTESTDLKKKSMLLKVVTAILIAADVCVFMVSYPKDSISFLDVGQGLCVVMTINGQTYCYDGGSSDRREVFSYIIKPYLLSVGSNQVDIWFVSHADNDHVSGLKDALSDDEIRVKRLCLSECRNEKADELVNIAKANMTEVYYASRGQKIEGKNVDFEVLAPKKGGYASKEINADSLVILVKTEAGNVLLAGDSGFEAEKDILSYKSIVNVYQTAHHGSAEGSNSKEFLEKLKPPASVISCGFENAYNHPHKETLERLDDCSSIVFRTDTDGAITVWLSHKEMKIKAVNLKGG